MPEATYFFPEGFLWGTATAAHQVEGDNTNNNWYAWENESGHIYQNQKSGLACDWWGGRWREDLENAARDGQNAHRFSIEWSRVQPAPDKWDDGALDFYRQMLKGMRELGLTPVVTLHHFSDPLWIYEMGGWENDRTPEFFEKFVRKIVAAFKDEVKLWVTLNEPNGLVVNAYIDGSFPPGKRDFKAAFIALKNLVRGHALAYHAIHDIQPNAMVGYALYYRGFFPKRDWFPPDYWVTKTLKRNVNDVFANAIRSGQVNFTFFKTFVKEAIGTQDYIGLQYYSSDLVSFNLLKPGEFFSKREYPKDAALSKMGFIADVPEGMAQGLRWAHQFKLPIYITENGVEDPDGSMRPTYLLRHLREVWRAANFNWQVKGYFHWSQVDNFEWERGWSQRFGLWGIDPESQVRTRRRSADLYAAICKENGISSKTVRRLAPEAFDILFPA
ncbi:MAG TPA: family 1 glycosylhydrolase [Pelolinea sp.]|nr:family 1 glycosylhydrolase [Pelolinea sp.]